MSATIRLLGAPAVKVDHRPSPPPKGRKAWALLAYLIASPRGITRTELASLLFSDADDPMATLRRNIFEVRRLLGAETIPRGDLVSIELPPEAHVDVQVLQRGTWVEASQITGLGRDLLEGMDFPSAPAFEAWLLNERRHLKRASEAVLREAAMFRLTAGDPSAAADLALRLISLEPLEEAYHALLIRAYLAAGDRPGAERQRQACVELFRRELQTRPGPLVMDAVSDSPHPAPARRVSGGSAVRALVEAGEAAAKGGAIDHAIGSLQTAVIEASAHGDPGLEALARFALGSTLAHSGRNRFEEAAFVLYPAARSAEEAGDHTLAAATYREIAWVELLAARYVRVGPLLDRAEGLAGGDPGERAAILFVRGMGLTEVGRYGDSMKDLDASIRLAKEVGDARRVGLALSMLGKAHVFRRELPQARAAFDEALHVFRANDWTSLIPWTEAYLAELEYVEGHIEVAEDLYAHAFTLACEIDDPCFKTKTEVGLGLVLAARGQLDEAMTRLSSARMWLVQTPDHLWTMACALDASCSVAIANGMDTAQGWVEDLESLAGRTGMRELLVRAYLHRHQLGDSSALATAALLARGVDNPHLSRTIAALTSGAVGRIPA